MPVQGVNRYRIGQKLTHFKSTNIGIYPLGSKKNLTTGFYTLILTVGSKHYVLHTMFYTLSSNDWVLIYGF